MQASMVVQDVVDLNGGGFGTTVNLLTVQHSGAPGDLSGCIAGGPGGTLLSGDCAIQGGTFAGGDEHNPTNTNFNNLVTFNGTGAASLQFGFNAAEPGNNTTLTLTNLVLTLYGGATGATPLYSTSGIVCGAGVADCSAAAGGGVTLNTQTGIGNWGFVLGLDESQAGDLNAAGAGRLGLAASLSGVSGGPDTFFLIGGGGGGGSEIPEPMTFGLMAAGLAGLGVLRRFR
jgi:hypothetical protein